MRIVLCAVALSTVAGVAGCGLFDSTSSGTSDSVTLATATTAGEAGTATLTSTASTTTQIALTVSGGTDTGVQSAAIFSGTCGTAGTIYEQLNNVQGDASVTDLQVALSTLEGSKYYIAVNSSTDVTLEEACGEIP